MIFLKIKDIKFKIVFGFLLFIISFSYILIKKSKIILLFNITYNIYLFTVKGADRIIFYQLFNTIGAKGVFATV